MKRIMRKLIYAEIPHRSTKSISLCIALFFISEISACSVNHGNIDTQTCENEYADVEPSNQSEADQFVGRSEPITTVVTGSYTIKIYEDGYSEMINSPFGCTDGNMPWPFWFQNNHWSRSAATPRTAGQWSPGKLIPTSCLASNNDFMRLIQLCRSR